MAGITDFLTPEAMRKLETLVVRSRYVVEGFRAGMHASPLKGASVEFADHRQYVKGDNLRNLDWKVFGRTERYYVKRFLRGGDQPAHAHRHRWVRFHGSFLRRPSLQIHLCLPRGGRARLHR